MTIFQIQIIVSYQRVYLDSGMHVGQFRLLFFIAETNMHALTFVGYWVFAQLHHK